MVRVRFVFCRFGFSFTEYIHATSFSMWCERERFDAVFDLVPLDEALRWSLCWLGLGLGLEQFLSVDPGIELVRVRVRVRVRGEGITSYDFTLHFLY